MNLPTLLTVRGRGLRRRERIGYLLSYAAETLDLSIQGSRQAPVQLFSARWTDGARVEGWIWIGDEPAQWEYNSDNRPPMTTDEKRVAAARGADPMVADAVAGGGVRAEEFKAGTVGGIHYLQTVEPIKQLKRDGRPPSRNGKCCRQDFYPRRRVTSVGRLIKLAHTQRGSPTPILTTAHVLHSLSWSI